MSLLPAALRTSGRSPATEYLPFGNVEMRNGLQALVEIPLMIGALRLPHLARVLEIGCGRGVALPELDDRLEPVELIGLDIDGDLLTEARDRVRNTCTHATLVEGDVRSFGRTLPWYAVPSLVPDRSGVLWGVRRKLDG